MDIIQQYVGSFFFYLGTHYQDPPIFLGHPVIYLDHHITCHCMNSLHLSTQALSAGHLGCFWSFNVIQDTVEHLVLALVVQAWECPLGMFWRIKLLSFRGWECLPTASIWKIFLAGTQLHARIGKVTILFFVLVCHWLFSSSCFASPVAMEEICFHI